jgi:spore coat protein U-like protein
MTRNLGFAAMLLIWSGGAKAACTLSTTGVPFGIYNPSATTDKLINGTITITCTPSSGSSSYQIALSTGGGTSYAGRRMASGANLLPYQLFVDAALTQIWGNGTSGTSVATGTSTVPINGGSHVFQVHGRIVAKRVANPGSYTDTIIATVTY